MSKPIWQGGIIKQLANKYDIDEKEIEKAVYHQFKFVKNVMKKGDFKSVRLPRWGKFYVNPKRVQKLNEYNNEQ